MSDIFRDKDQETQAALAELGIFVPFFLLILEVLVPDRTCHAIEASYPPIDEFMYFKSVE